MDISKTYQPNEIEKKWYNYWMENKYFHAEKDETKKPFSILIPPPNVTGILHMGHVLNNTLQDTLIRYKRMTGVPTLWLPGVDHAGIATQNVVEKGLKAEGLTRHQLGREKLLERIWKWKDEKGGRIIEQLKQLGCSCDWDRERFTMDEVLSKAVKEVFVHLYEKDLIYKGKYIINWCPRCTTALANDEVDYEDEKGKLWNIKYPLKSGKGFLTIATTRPETMLGDVAVAVNPKDERYADLIGETLILPFVEREIPIIADDYVEKDFGSGCVKITPAHDPNDFEVGLRHDLERILIMDEHGVMNEKAGKDFEGMDRYECRKKILKMLKERDLLAEIEDHDHQVGHCYRCATVIEPYLSDQWFVRMKPLAERAIDVVKSGEIKLVPERWTKVYLHWMDNIRDWCISRQIWWGHRIPVFYCDDCGEMTVTTEDITECPKCKSGNIRQDEDVLDTWFSSWLWPFSTMGWPEETEDLNYFLPTSTLVTAPGIIYLWVARMIMSTLEFRDVIPFDTVLLHGMVLDETGRKMSKSFGNSPDPIDIIKSHGADALRFSMIFNTPRGQDSYYSEAILDNGRNFANKIWNAYRYIMGNVENIEGIPTKDELEMELADHWIYSRLNNTVKTVIDNLEKLRFNDAASAMQDFIWKEYCSWYLELSKERIYDKENAEGQRTAKYILLDILEKSMRLLHPIMPFITEEIWQSLKSVFPMDEDALIIAKYPEADENLIDLEIEAQMSKIQECISTVRNLRKQVNIAPGKKVNISIKTVSDADTELTEKYSYYFRKLANIEDINVGTEIVKPKSSIASVAVDMEIYLHLDGLIDLEAEKARINKQLGKLEGELKRITGKLNNKKFVDNAPEQVVAKEKEKFEEVSTKVNKMKEMLDNL